MEPTLAAQLTLASDAGKPWLCRSSTRRIDAAGGSDSFCH